MRPLDGHSILEAWDRGLSQNALGRALVMLAAGSPERGARELLATPIVDRDRELLERRRATFGDVLRGFVPCASCGTSLEVEARVSSLLQRLDRIRTDRAATREVGGFVVSMRPATSEDLAVATAAPEDPGASRLLLRRCACVRPDAELSGELEQVAIEMFEDLHRDAEILFTLDCPACGATQTSELDIARFLWRELASAGISLLRDIDELARAYGWSEDAILRMSPARREFYLELVRS
jgi:hypothetical protein